MATSIDIESGLTPTNLTPLAHFHHLIGRNSSTTGLYTRTIAQERNARIAYISTAWISNTLFMLQIILAATFTALSAYKDTFPVVLTILGALNTVIAGALAWQKGQGVPQRYRKAQDDYQALLADIDDTERSIDHLDPALEAARLQKLYRSARENQQANYPDLLVGSKSEKTSDLSAKIEASLAKLDPKVAGKAGNDAKPLIKDNKMMDTIETKI